MSDFVKSDRALGARFASALEELGSPLNAPFALAVSGGGDSVALMHLAADWLRAHRVPLTTGSVLTVDHGLRPGSAREAAATAAWAKRLGFAAHTLTRRGSKPRSNIEDAARTARYRLIGEWCRTNKVATVLLAHTRDDQAETFLLRLGRGSGVDGLSAMRARAPFPVPGYDGVTLIRPLLGIGRDELRADLRARDAAWLEDPMNEDDRFARVRIRQMMPALEAAGLSAARMALDEVTEQVLARHAQFAASGHALLDGSALRAEPREIGLRALSAILMRVSGQTYRPRFERLERLYESLCSIPSPLEGEGGPKGRKGGDVSARSERASLGSARTLSGCRIGPAPKESRPFGTATLEIRRETPRRRGTAGKDAARKTALPKTAPASAGAKLPKKRRIIGRLSRS